MAPVLPPDLLRDLPNCRSILFLTGAGISVAAGIPAFRDPDNPERVNRLTNLSTVDALQSMPHEFHSLFNDLRCIAISARPTKAHQALAKLQSALTGLEVNIVTQNIDRLHERAGSPRVIRLHGDIEAVRCSDCGHAMRWHSDLEGDEICPSCENQGSIRPDVVLFGERPHNLLAVERDLRNCQMLCAIGCSLEVFPASGFVGIAQRHECVALEINPTLCTSIKFDYSLCCDADTGVKALTEAIMMGRA
jgi:NAD-dependent deacetylase